MDTGSDRGDYNTYVGMRNRGQSYYGPQTRRAAHFRRERYRDGQNPAVFLPEVSGQTGAFSGQSTQSGGLRRAQLWKMIAIDDTKGISL